LMIWSISSMISFGSLTVVYSSELVSSDDMLMSLMIHL
jgi:hypothetical protein